MPNDNIPTEVHEIQIPAKEYKVACQVASRIGRAASGNAIVIKFMERTMAKWGADDPKPEVLAKYLQIARDAGAPHKFNLRLPVPMCDLIRKAVANPRTGEVTQIPVGIDPGFAYNPGIARQQALQEVVDGKLRSTDPALANAARRAGLKKD